MDLIFICKKCDHKLYITNGTKLTGKELYKKLINLECPNCGEEPGELWTFEGIGNFKKRDE